MNIQFESWQAFWHMGGYGFFVWLSFGVTLASILLLVAESYWAKKQLVKAVTAQLARKKRIQQSKQQPTDVAAQVEQSVTAQQRKEL
ncbi:heme exporter protein CcmD [Aliiglaciecola sp. LCG003]|uniref:heme exporter protein CcmD n=1 Tax=Aliiglaciecola sp. LCG003 TaxID=3053655 RepID=UPI0025740B15|nr:heme exporter protein CcmD [Aliiglaciecola sp. LCG003]WJG08588.1 heme exporter protein CcmD [Aliiglaciecola sp. LCG003]